MKRVRNKWIFTACFCLSVTFLSGSTDSKFGSLYPFASIEANIFASERLYDDNNWRREITFTHWNIASGGVQYQKSIFFSSVSFAGLWKPDKFVFLPAFDVNLGIDLKNLYVYGGKNFSLLENNETFLEDMHVSLTSPVYAGGKYIVPTKNIILELGAQISRGKIHSPYVGKKETYFAYALNSRISVKAKDWLHPYISLMVQKYDFCKDFSVNIGIGAFIGKSNRMSGIKPSVIQTPSYSVPEKPNIYLYPEKATKVKVSVKPNGRMTASIPPYNNGWDVMAYPDGKIDGTSGYLFYEAEVYLNHLEEKGWCIPMSGLEMFFKNTLEKYGFNSTEIKDFVDYWTQRLPESSFYGIYPLLIESLEKICPLNIKPNPDKIFRLWLVFSPLSERKYLDTPKIHSFDRTGFVVTEWGGILKE